MAHPSVDWQAMGRLDNGIVIDFLTSSVSALSTCGLIDQALIDDVRVNLSEITSQGDSRSRPVLIELATRNAEVVALLVGRYGTAGLARNLLRYSLRRQVDGTIRSLSELGIGLLGKTELMFNRSIGIYARGQCLRHTLYSSVLIDLTQAVTEAIQDIQAVRDGTCRLLAADLAGYGPKDQSVDKAVAEALGFTSVERPTALASTERPLLRRWALPLERIIDSFRTFANLLMENGSPPVQVADMLTSCSRLQSEVNSMDSMSFPDIETLPAWEAARATITMAASLTKVFLDDLAEATLAAIGSKVDQPHEALPGALKRRLIINLIAAGQPPAKAGAAGDAFFTYLQAHKLRPSEVLEGELTRIHPALSAPAVAGLGDVAGNGVSQTAGSSDKSESLGMVQSLRARLKSHISGIPALVCLLAVGVQPLISGCGLKTRPTSDLSDLRPDIPFKAVPEPDGAESTQSKPAFKPNGGGGQ